MSCFGDITKRDNNFDETLETRVSRFAKCRISCRHVLVTQSPHLVASYETIDGELVPYESWTFPQLNRLSVPVVTSLEADGVEYMIAVQEPNSVTKWSFGDHKTRLEKHFFNAKIIGLIDGDVSGGAEPVVVYDNGFCQLLSTAIQTRREEHHKNVVEDEECIEWVDGLVDNETKDLLIVYLVTKSVDSSDGRMKAIYKLSLSLDTGLIVKTDRHSCVNAFTNWSLCRRTQSVLAINGSDEALVVYSLDGKSEKKFFEPFSTSVETVIGVAATRAGSLCLIGKSKESDYLLELWETRYGSKLGQIGLPYEPMANDCRVIDDCLYMTCFKGIVCIPLRRQSISLSQIVGKIKTKETPFVSQLNQQLKTICDDFEASSDGAYDEINRRLTEVAEQIGGNIPEDVILKLVTICSAKLQQNSCQELKALFERLVSLPFNDMFMISRLKSSKVRFSQILLSLTLLSDLLPSNKCAIFDWISILMDSHINQFIMNPNDETIKVLEAIDSKIDTSSQFYEHLGDIKALIDIIVNKNSDKSVPNAGLSLPKPKRGQYCIEILKF